jgi:hypothetical protein
MSSSSVLRGGAAEIASAGSVTTSAALLRRGAATEASMNLLSFAGRGLMVAELPLHQAMHLSRTVQQPSSCASKPSTVERCSRRGIASRHIMPKPGLASASRPSMSASLRLGGITTR